MKKEKTMQPECGDKWLGGTDGDGKIKCEKCGLSCYIVEADDSHSGESGDGKDE